MMKTPTIFNTNYLYYSGTKLFIVATARNLPKPYVILVVATHLKSHQTIFILIS